MAKSVGDMTPHIQQCLGQGPFGYMTFSSQRFKGSSILSIVNQKIIYIQHAEVFDWGSRMIAGEVSHIAGHKGAILICLTRILERSLYIGVVHVARSI